MKPKPGYLTTEFIGKCAVQLIAVLVLTGIIPTADQEHAGEIALGLIGAVEGAYAFARGLAKKPGIVVSEQPAAPVIGGKPFPPNYGG